eukprot:1086883-Pleurochrysis_carterae.AAC.1
MLRRVRIRSKEKHARPIRSPQPQRARCDARIGGGQGGCGSRSCLADSHGAAQGSVVKGGGAIMSRCADCDGDDEVLGVQR